MKPAAAAFLLLTWSQLVMANAGICGAGLQADTYFNLAVKAHKDRKISTEKLAIAAASPRPIDPMTSTGHAYDEIALKSAFATVTEREHTAQLWPQTTAKLAEYLINLGVETEAREKAHV